MPPKSKRSPTRKRKAQQVDQDSTPAAAATTTSITSSKSRKRQPGPNEEDSKPAAASTASKKKQERGPSKKQASKIPVKASQFKVAPVKSPKPKDKSPAKFARTRLAPSSPTIRVTHAASAASVAMPTARAVAAAAKLRASSSTTNMAPPSLHRTQSTPLELELHRQVTENCRADANHLPLPYTGAPPEHLLKFAPQQEDADDEENLDEEWVLADDHLVAQPPVSSYQRDKQHSNHHNWKWWLLLGLEVTALLLLFVHHNQTTHATLYQTITTGMPNLFQGTPCFAANSNISTVHMSTKCTRMAAAKQLTPCPDGGICAGGRLLACENDEFYVVAKNGAKCVVAPRVHRTYRRVVQLIQEWYTDHACRAQQQQPYHPRHEDHPQPIHYYETEKNYNGDEQKLPLYTLGKIQDALRNHNLRWNQVSRHALRQVIVGTTTKDNDTVLLEVLQLLNHNNQHGAGEWLKLHPIVRYDRDADETVSTTVHLVGPSGRLASTAMSSTLLPTSLVCIRHSWNWKQLWADVTSHQIFHLSLVAYAAVATLALAALAMHRILYLPYQTLMQRQFLDDIVVIRHLALERLPHGTNGGTWRVDHLRDVVVETFLGAEPHRDSSWTRTYLRDKVWPRVVFDIRGDPRVLKLTVENMSQRGGSRMDSYILAGRRVHDVWTWKGERTTD